MNITSSLLHLNLLLEGSDIDNNILPGYNRNLQTLPDYTSPPTDPAIEATPVPYRPDSVIDYAREASKSNICLDLDPGACQILFQPSKDFESNSSPLLGVLFYGGALVDPRSYSPLAKELAERYGIAVSIPIFYNDIGFTGCSSYRLELARRAFPSVEKWIMVGHSMGGIGVMAEVWSALSSGNEISNLIGGFALIASYVRQDIGCGEIDFSSYDIPTASVTAELDGVINQDNLLAGQDFLPEKQTLLMAIPGANHGNFGSYDDSERRTILGQNDGNATIPESVQQDLTISAIVHVVSRAGLPLPAKRRRNKGKKSKDRNNKGGSKRE
jgi:hypothetical protein